MGIHGVFKQIGAGERISLAKLSADHYTRHARPFRLAIDISIWLFQIQSGKGGSNPALRTFYYRLLRLLTLNIHPLFVFDGPNKPLFKRNKKVGGPGVRVASVPEFLAKQLLKQFAFPWHVAPGEAEAECALLQREGVVDAVLSEDVDTLMFGSGVTLRNWTSEGSSKTPTHVNVYRATETKARSGMDREGMILVALMSGGDYLPEGIAGCGPKVACDAARAGFGQKLCALGRRDEDGMREWKERLQNEIRTNSSQFFTRKNTGFTIPEDFPNIEVLGYYTHPCISTPDKVARLREGLQWDQAIDFAALRSFAADAFDWRCVGGAKKFIRNLAPAMLIRELRLVGEADEQPGQEGEEAQAEREKAIVTAVHGKRTHATTDGSLEYRISFTPGNLIPIDLSIEDEDDDFLPAGGEDSDGDEAADFQLLPSASEEGGDSEAQPTSPSKKKRTMRPYDPTQLEKVWILKPFLQVGRPLLVEEYEASFRDPKAFMQARRKAKAAGAAGDNTHAPKPKRGGGKKKAGSDMPANALMAYAQVTKATKEREKNRQPLQETTSLANSQPNNMEHSAPPELPKQISPAKVSAFKLPAAQIPRGMLSKYVEAPVLPSAPVGKVQDVEVIHLDDETTPRPFARFARKRTTSPKQAVPEPSHDAPATPNRRKRRSPELSSPAASQRTIRSYYSPSPRKAHVIPGERASAFVNLVSSSPVKHTPVAERRLRQRTPTPPDLRTIFVRSSIGGDRLDAHEAESGPLPAMTACSSPPPQARSNEEFGLGAFSPSRLPDTVTKRRRKGPLRRNRTAPVGGDYDEDHSEVLIPSPSALITDMSAVHGVVEAMDLTLASPSPRSRKTTPKPIVCEVEEMSDDDLPSPSSLFPTAARRTNIAASLSHSETSIPPSPPPDYTPHPAATRNTTLNTSIVQPGRPHTETPREQPAPPTVPSRRSPRHHAILSPPKATTAKQRKKTAILLRQSLEGAWKEVDAESVDMTGDGSGFKQSRGRAKVLGVGRKAWRKSGVEVLDLTGA